MKAINFFSVLYAFCLITSSIINYRDPTHFSRKNNLISTEKVKLMLNRVLKPEDTSINMNYDDFFIEKNQNKPGDIIEDYLSHKINKSKINNAIKLICLEDAHVSGFDWDVYIEKSIHARDLDVVKATLYSFRELFSLWSAAKSVEILFSHDVDPINFLCDEETIDLDNPSSFFITNKNKLQNLKVEQILRTKNEFQENDQELNKGFKFTVKPLTNEISNEQAPKKSYFRDLINNSNIQLDKTIEISYIKANQENHLVSSIKYYIVSNIKTSAKDNLKLVYSSMLLESKIHEILNKVFFSVFQAHFSNMFKVYYSLNYNPMSNLNKQLKNNLLTKYISNIELGLSANFLLGEQLSSYATKLKPSTEKAIKNIFGLEYFKELEANEITKLILNKFNNHYLKDEIYKNCQELSDFLYPKASNQHEDDIEFILKSTASLCFFNKAIKEIEKAINVDKTNLLQNYLDFMSSNKNYSNSLLYSAYLQEPINLTTIHSNIFDLAYINDIKMNLTKEDTFTIINSKINKIFHITRNLFVSFDVITTNYNDYLDNAKYILYKCLFETADDYLQINHLLNNPIKNNNELTLSLNKNLDKVVEKEHKLKIKEVRSALVQLTNFYNIVKVILKNQVFTFENKIFMIRNLFYSYYYNDYVPKEDEAFVIESIGKKVIFTDFFKNAQYLEKLTNHFSSILDVFFYEDKAKEDL